MINYSYGFFSDWKCSGSVIPRSCMVALPSALLGIFIEYNQKNSTFGWHWGEHFFEINAKAYALFCFVLGFLIIFRTQGAYARFTMGSHSLDEMRVALFDSAVCMMTFTAGTKVNAAKVKEFKHVVVRLLSLLYATFATKLESKGLTQSRLDNLEIIDLEGLDEEFVAEVTMSQSDHAALLTYYHLNVTITDAINSGLIHAPPPIAGRCYAKLSEGFAKFEHCRKIALVPFPFPYAQTTLWLLLVHWFITPFVMCSWVAEPHLGPVFLFTFLLVALFWSMVFISWELENPFGEDDNDLDIAKSQKKFNKRLRKLFKTSMLAHIPSVSCSANINENNVLGEYTSQEEACGGESDSSGDESEPMTSRSGRVIRGSRG